MANIQAYSGTLNRDDVEWVFVDLGFSEKAKSCGVLVGAGTAASVIRG